jgi:NitT/TauT family transport system permease protein
MKQSLQPLRPSMLLKAFFVKYWGVLFVLVAWQIAVSYGKINVILMPSPESALVDIGRNWTLYVQNGVGTGLVASFGLLAGMSVGILLAIVVWSSPVLSGLIVPLAIVFSSVPVVALIPVLARLLGYDVRTVLGIVAIISFFPSFVFAGVGLRSIPPGSSDLFRVLGASAWKRFIFLAMPAAVPSLAVALRLTAPSAVLSALLAEFLMGRSGLGYLLRQSSATFSTDRAFGVIIISTIVSIACFTSAIAIQNSVDKRWK